MKVKQVLDCDWDRDGVLAFICPHCRARAKNKTYTCNNCGEELEELKESEIRK